jgi:hypothetical protein
VVVLGDAVGNGLLRGGRCRSRVDRLGLGLWRGMLVHGHLSVEEG